MAMSVNLSQNGMYRAWDCLDLQGQ